MKMLGEMPSLPVATSARKTTPEAVTMRSPTPPDERHRSPSSLRLSATLPDLIIESDLPGGPDVPHDKNIVWRGLVRKVPPDLRSVEDRMGPFVTHTRIGPEPAETSQRACRPEGVVRGHPVHHIKTELPLGGVGNGSAAQALLLFDNYRICLSLAFHDGI